MGDEHTDRQARAILLVALLGALLALALPASAGAYIYWSNQGSGTIGRANLDGTSASQSFVTGATGACQPAVDGAHVYWTDDDGAGRIGRANLNGSEADPNFITGGTDTCGVAVDGAHVYWANLGSNAIGRANLDGTEVDQSFITGVEDPQGVGVDAGHIYWGSADKGRVGRANLNGTAKDLTFITEASYPCGVAVNGSHVYWANEDGQTIGRANLNGTEVDQSFITGATFPCGVAIDDAHIYWANSANKTSIGRANLDGSSKKQNFITGVSEPTGVAVDTLPHPSATALACAPSTLILPATASCTATVSDATAPMTPPTGTVAFSSSGLGAFGPTTSCLLVPSTAAASACQLTYTASAIGSPAIAAAYGGEFAHSPSNGTVPLRVNPSNAFKLSRPKLNRKTGAAILTATVPGAGQLVLKGKAIERLTKRARAAGKVRLAVRPAKRTRARLRRAGRARILVRVTYTPTGGTPDTKAKALKLIRPRHLAPGN